MHKTLRTWSIIGIFIVFALAAFWHFLYELVPIPIVGAISPINESPWEHVKLFFVPAILYYIVLYFIAGKNYPNFIFAHSIALLIMPVFMLIFYYLYESRVDETIVLDMINSLLTVAFGAAVGYRLTTSNADYSSAGYKVAAVVIVLAMLITYVVFTFNPPDCEMFKVKE